MVTELTQNVTLNISDIHLCACTHAGVISYLVIQLFTVLLLMVTAGT